MIDPLVIKVISFVLANKNALSRKVDDVVRDLKFIRFDDEGILSLVDALIEDRQINRAKAQAILGDFNDHQWNVDAALERLSAEALQDVKGISRLTRHELVIIKDGKTNVRRNIQNSINYYLQPGVTVDREELRRWRTQVVELNAAIDEAEDVLLHGRKARLDG